MGGRAATVSGFDAWAKTYEHSALQSMLFIPAQRAAIRVAQALVARPRRVLDVGCGTGRLLRQVRRRYPRADLVGVDVAWGMVAAASAAGSQEAAIGYVRASVERLPFADGAFDLVLATMSVRHWNDLAAGIAEVDRVLTVGGLFVLADVLPVRQRPVWAWRVERHHRRAPTGSRTAVGAELARHGLTVVGGDHVRWPRPPDIQVIAAHKPHRSNLDPEQRTGWPRQPPKPQPGRGLDDAASAHRLASPAWRA